MATKLNPYLGFDNKAKDAMEFYKSVFGGELTMSTFGESGMGQDPADAGKIMHAQLIAENGMTLMASDVPSNIKKDEGSSISLSLSGDNEEELKNFWNKLSDGANITMPLNQAPWGDTFGMLVDKFGITWLVNISGKKA